MRRRTATRSASRTASVQSASDQAARSGSRANGGSQYRRSRRLPSGSTTSTVAGGSLPTPRRIVRGAGTIECQLR